MLDKRNQVYGLVLALFAVLTASVAPTLVKVGVDANNDPITLLMLRLWIASAIFWVFFSIAQPEILRIDSRALVFTSAAGAANSAGLILFYLAIQHLDASVATMLFSFYPLFTVLMLALRGERLRLKTLLFLSMSLFGIYLFLKMGGDLNLVGILFILGTTFAYALHLNIVQWYLSDYPAQTSAIYIITTMAIITTLVWLFGPRDFSPISAIGWISIGGTALLSTVLTRLTLFAAIRRLGSAQVSFFGPLEILLGVLWAVLLLGERLSMRQWFGGLLILASMVWTLRNNKVTTSSNK